MTLPSSGPISINDIAAEFGLPNNSRFPDAFYGKGGAPASGPLSFADFYGRSNYGISADRASISLNGFGQSDTCTFTATGGTTIASITLIAGSDNPRITKGATGGTTTTISATTPGSGNGFYSATFRVTTANGQYVDLLVTGNWGNA